MVSTKLMLSALLSFVHRDKRPFHDDTNPATAAIVCQKHIFCTEKKLQIRLLAPFSFYSSIWTDDSKDYVTKKQNKEAYTIYIGRGNENTISNAYYSEDRNIVHHIFIFEALLQVLYRVLI